VLKCALKPIKECYGFILLDCPPTLGMLTANVLAAAESVINCGFGVLVNVGTCVRVSPNTSLRIYAKNINGTAGDLRPVVSLKH
jgi:hypothetical protein